MLITSFVFNIAALIAPFVVIDLSFSSNLIYSLPHLVELMWHFDLYVIAVLIIIYSILLPFVKLAVLTYICFFTNSYKRRSRLIALIEPCGKWSMLDIFCVCIILVLTNNQFFVSSTPLNGVYYFLIAVFLNMSCAIIIHLFVVSKSRPPSTYKIRTPISNFLNVTIGKRIRILLLLVISLIALLTAIISPFIQINAFLMSDYSYSIYSCVLSLWSVSIALALFITFTLILCPLLQTIGLMLFWSIKYKANFHGYLHGFINIISNFNMIGVFFLGLVVFLSEGNWLINTQNKIGLVILCAYLILSYVILICLNLKKSRLIWKKIKITDNKRKNKSSQ